MLASQKKKLRTYWENTMTVDERNAIATLLEHIDQLDDENDEVEIPYDLPISKEDLKELLNRMGNEMKRSPFLKMKSKGRNELHVKLLNLYMMQFIRAYNIGR